MGGATSLLRFPWLDGLEDHVGMLKFFWRSSHLGTTLSFWCLRCKEVFEEREVVDFSEGFICSLFSPSLAANTANGVRMMPMPAL
jgi:hypothetical protein